MKKDEIFFGEDGLTMTSANYIANQCKNAYARLEKELDNIRFYNKYVLLIGTSQKEVISDGITSVADVTEKLERVAKLKSLIAWLREAISAKERLLREVTAMSYEDFNIVIPERPEAPKYITVDDVVGIWDVKQRNRYYYLETLCAQIGKYIHPDGVFSKEREKLYDAIHNPRETMGSGRDTVVYHYEPSINPDEVEDKFMELQNLHRSYQSELNSMKYEIETIIQDKKKNEDLRYQKEYKEYALKMKECENELNSIQNDAISKVQRLKIIIPNSLKSIYEEVSELGKKK